MSTMEIVEEVLDVVSEKGPHCKVTHQGCSHVAVAMGHPTCGSKPVVFICAEWVKVIEDAKAFGGVCGACERPVEECWQYVPI